jgi:hypothetical protein
MSLHDQLIYHAAQTQSAFLKLNKLFRAVFKLWLVVVHLMARSIIWHVISTLNLKKCDESLFTKIYFKLGRKKSGLRHLWLQFFSYGEKKAKLQLFMAKGNVMTAVWPTCVPTFHAVDHSYWKFEKHWFRETDHHNRCSKCFPSALKRTFKCTKKIV